MYKNKEDQKRAFKEWYLKNKDKVSVRGKEYRKTHKKEIDDRVKKWRLEHPEKVKEWERKRDAKTGATTQGRLNGTMKTSIRVCLKGNKKWRKWEYLVGYTVEQLKKHLEKNFKEGMRWDNYGSYWEIDHIIPKAAFNYHTAEDIDFKKCWSLKNLQPLECSINRRKKDIVGKPFQPSLAISL